MESKYVTNTKIWFKRGINSRVSCEQDCINNFVIGNNFEEQPLYLQQVVDFKK